MFLRSGVRGLTGDEPTGNCILLWVLLSCKTGLVLNIFLLDGGAKTAEPLWKAFVQNLLFSLNVRQEDV